MPLSHYLLTLPLPSNPDQLLLYSTRKTSFIQLPAQTFARIASGQVPDSLAAPLTQMGFLVADPVAERAEVRLSKIRINELNPGVRVAVILGMACNFACHYCYEGALKGNNAMGDAVASQAIAFLQERFRPGKKRLVLDFYGGEPLLYPGRIKSMAQALQSFILARGGDFRFTLVTNGSLLTRQTVTELLPLGLTSVKVTIDGPPETHNRSRPYQSGKESFDVIMRNIRECCDLVKITLGGNFTCDNYRRFPELLEILIQNDLTPDKLAAVKFDAVMAVNDDVSQSGFGGGSASTGEPWLIEAALMLREEVLKRGYNYPKLAPASCMVDLDDNFTIDWDGTLYKCVTLIGHPEYQAGDIFHGLGDYATTYHLDHWQNNDHCRDCLYLPLCFGGCRYAEYQRNGSMARPDCQREYFDQALPAMLLQDWKCRGKTDPLSEISHWHLTSIGHKYWAMGGENVLRWFR